MRHVKEDPHRVRGVVRAYALVVIPFALIASQFGLWMSILLLWVMATGSLLLPLICNYYTSPHNNELRGTCTIYVAVTNGVAAALWIVVLVLIPDGGTDADVFLMFFTLAALAGIFSWLISWGVFRLVTLFTDPILNRLRRIPDRFECQECGYDLTGNVSGRCPECGTWRG